MTNVVFTNYSQGFFFNYMYANYICSIDNFEIHANKHILEFQLACPSAYRNKREIQYCNNSSENN